MMARDTFLAPSEVFGASELEHRSRPYATSLVCVRRLACAPLREPWDVRGGTGLAIWLGCVFPAF